MASNNSYLYQDECAHSNDTLGVELTIIKLNPKCYYSIRIAFAGTCFRLN